MGKKIQKFNIHANRLRRHLSVAFASAFFLNAVNIQKKGGKKSKYKVKTTFNSYIGITFNWRKILKKLNTGKRGLDIFSAYIISAYWHKKFK